MAEDELEISIGVKGKRVGDVPSDWKDIVRGIPGVVVVAEEARSLRVRTTRDGLQKLRCALGEDVFHITYFWKAPPRVPTNDEIFSRKGRMEI